jgi:hypothetical protein
MTEETPLPSDRQPRSTETSKRRALRRCASDQRGTSGNSEWCEVRVGRPQAYLSYHANCAAAPTDAKGQFRKAVQTRCIRVTPEFGRNLAFNAKSRLV